MVVVVLVLAVVLMLLVGMLVYRDVKGRTRARALDPVARRHAERASELLLSVERRLEWIKDITPAQHLDLVAGGGIKQHNSEIDTSLMLARSHALTSLALQGLPAGALDSTGDHENDAAAVRELVHAGGGGGPE